MTWITDNKGAGPWPFTKQWSFTKEWSFTKQTEKPCYDEGDKTRCRPPGESPVWGMVEDGSVPQGVKHNPCGYWYGPEVCNPRMELQSEYYQASNSLPRLIYHTDGYLYKTKGTTTGTSSIEKIDPGTMTLVSELSLPDPLTGPSFSIALDSSGSKFYVTTAPTTGSFKHAKITRIDPSTFTIEKQRCIGSVVFGTDGNNYICTFSHTSASNTKPITGASWSSVWALLTTPHEDTETWASGVAYVLRGASQALVYASANGKLYYVNTSSVLTEVGASSLAYTGRNLTLSGYLNTASIVAENYLYLGSGPAGGGAAEIVKIDFSTLTEVARLTPSSPSALEFTGLVSYGSYLYAVEGEQGPDTRLLKINPSDMSITLSTIPAWSGTEPSHAFLLTTCGTMLGVISNDYLHIFDLNDLSLQYALRHQGGGSTFGKFGVAFGDHAYVQAGKTSKFRHL